MRTCDLVERTAVHESGHAVMALLLGAEDVERMAIYADGSGSVRYTWPAGMFLPPRRYALLASSGLVAESLAGYRLMADLEALYGGTLETSPILGSAAISDVDVFPVTVYMHGAPPARLTALLRGAARLLRAHWAELAVLAFALAERGELTGPEVAALLVPM